MAYWERLRKFVIRFKRLWEPSTFPRPLKAQHSSHFYKPTKKTKAQFFTKNRFFWLSEKTKKRRRRKFFIWRSDGSKISFRISLIIDKEFIWNGLRSEMVWPVAIVIGEGLSDGIDREEEATLYLSEYQQSGEWL